MSAVAAPASRPRSRRRRNVSGGAGALGLGVATLWLSLIVLLPLAAVVDRSLQDGLQSFWDSVSSKQAVDALRFTLLVSLVVTAINAVMGTLIAWVLVRDEFRGKRALNALIDLPFALPTIVAGLVIMALYGPRTPIDFTIGSHHFDANVTFTRGAIYIALLFVTLPFVVRTVQPVLIELDQELEDAARSLGASGFTTFRRIVLPSILPGMLSGIAMAFARAVGEIGAIVLIAGNLPFKTEVASIHLFHRIEQDPEGSAAVAVVLLLISFTVLLGIGGVRWYVTRHEHG
jgi:sulfate/thiosulfate transport system permease protein